MAHDIFFSEAIRNALLAANEASAATAEAATSQGSRTLDLIAEKLREELPEGTSQFLLDALHAAAVGSVDTLKHYRRGYRAALVTLALAFGIAPAVVPRLTAPAPVPEPVPVPVVEGKMGLVQRIG